MKKKIVVLLILLSSFGIFSNAEEHFSEIDIEKYSNIIFSIIGNLSKIIENNNSSDIVYNTYIVSENAIRNNLVSFKIDPKLDTVMSGMNFSTYETGEISLVFGLKFLDTYSINSSIHYSILIHEYRHLHDYLKGGENFINAKKDEKESYWYELDALRIESEFIKHYLAGKYSLSKFEEYLLNSLEKDYLNVASMIMHKESMNYFFYFDNLEKKYIENEISEEEIIEELERNGDTLIKAYNTVTDNLIIYLHYIEISTFRKYMIRILRRIINNPTMTWDEVFVKYNQIGLLYKSISEILDEDSEKQNLYIKSIYKLWEEDLNKN